MCFLSRPRRFGKTLTVSTLEAIFQGRRELFKDLAIDKTDYDWKTYPVIPIDFGDMCDALKAGETKRYMEVLASFFAGIPYMDGRRKEADYALVVLRRQVPPGEGEDGPPLGHRLQFHGAHRPGVEGRGAGLKDPFPFERFSLTCCAVPSGGLPHPRDCGPSPKATPSDGRPSQSIRQGNPRHRRLCWR